MKKTLVTIATLALAAASSQADVLSTVTFETNRTGEGPNVIMNTSSNYGLVSTTGTIRYAKEFFSSTYIGLINDDKIPANIYVPDLLVCGQEAVGQRSLIVTVLTNTSNQDLRISSLDLSLIGIDQDYNPATGLNGGSGYNSAGQFTEGRYNRLASSTVVIENGRGVIGIGRDTVLYNLSTVASADPGSGSWEGVHTGTFDFSTQNIVLAPGVTAQFEIAVEPDAGDRSVPSLYAGITGFVVHGEALPLPVPEPATASLSLLGLAALMMRRRRA